MHRKGQQQQKAEVTLKNSQQLAVANTRAPTPTLPPLNTHLIRLFIPATHYNDNVSLVPLDEPFIFSDNTDRAILLKMCRLYG